MSLGKLSTKLDYWTIFIRFAREHGQAFIFPGGLFISSEYEHCADCVYTNWDLWVSWSCFDPSAFYYHLYLHNCLGGFVPCPPGTDNILISGVNELFSPYIMHVLFHLTFSEW